MGRDTERMPVPVQEPEDVTSVGGHGRTGVTAAGRSHRGCRRAENQDRMYVGDRVFAVADGVGGHEGGDVAAEIALQPVAALDPAPEDRADSGMALRDAVHTANAEVQSRRQADPTLRGMGTTLTAMVLSGTEAHIAHVGDSRLYRLRDGAVEQLTSDHSFVQWLVDTGRLSPEAARDHPKKNLVTRAVGTRAQVEVDTAQTPIAAGDTFVICSDGLLNALDDDTFAEVLCSQGDVSDIADGLIREALRAGVSDNVTAVVVRTEEATSS